MSTIDAFLSYNTKDHEFARSLCDALRNLGVNVWIDEEHREAHETWPKVIAEAISNVNYFVALFGPHGIGEEQEREMNFALKLQRVRRIGVIPVLIPGYDENKGNPYEDYVSSNYNHHNLRGGLDESKIHALASLIKHDIIPTPTPSPMPGEDSTPVVMKVTSTLRRVLLLSGGSGSRTGTLSVILAERLTSTLGENSCRVLPMERYYTGSFQTRSEAHTNRYGDGNFDNPDIIDFDQMVSDIEKLRAGSAIQIPKYDKQAHSPTGFELIHSPSDFVILEGAYLLQDKRIRAISDASFYINVESEVRFANRVWKDVNGFKMDLSEVLNYYFRAVKPAFDRWVHPFGKQAKLVQPLKATDYSRFDFARGQVPLNFSSAADKMMTFLKRSQIL